MRQSFTCVLSEIEIQTKDGSVLPAKVLTIKKGDRIEVTFETETQRPRVSLKLFEKE